MTRRRSRGCSLTCSLICSLTPIGCRRRRSPSISTPPTIRGTGIRRSASSTAITTTTVICRFRCSAAGICWPPNCARPTSTRAPAASKRSRGSPGQARGPPAFASAGRRACPWPEQGVRILLRAASGFARETLMAWCENNSVDFLFGLAKNARLNAEIETELAAAQEQSQRTGKPARRFKDFTWRTRKSWSCERRVVAKAEWTRGEANPRFVVTSLAREEHEARHLYEKLYCARGEMENRIKECQLDLYADRTSAHTMRANQLRRWFASMAYVLIGALRRVGLAHPQFARASCGTIRLKLLKIGALVRTSVRRIKLAMPSAFPYQAEYHAAYAALTAAAR